MSTTRRAGNKSGAKNDKAGNAQREQQQRNKPNATELTGTHGNPKNSECRNNDRANRIQTRNLPERITCSPSNQMSKSRPTQSIWVFDFQSAPVCSE